MTEPTLFKHRRVRRGRNGRVLWTKALCQHFRDELRRGKPLSDTARNLGISRAAVLQASARYSLMQPPKGFALVSDLKLNLRCTEPAIYGACEKLGITPTPWGQHRMLTLEQAEHVRAHRRLYVTPEEAQGMLTAVQAAAGLGITPRMFNLRVHELDIPIYRIQGTLGQQARYHKADVQRIDVPVAPIGCPSGFQPATALAPLLRMNESNFRKWAAQGCPHVRDRQANHTRYFQPSAVLAWLEANPVKKGTNGWTRTKRERVLQRLRELIANEPAALVAA